MSATAPHQRALHCLVGVDGSPLSLKALETACGLVQSPASTLSLISVVHNATIVMADPDEQTQLIAAENQRLHAVLESLLPMAKATGAQVQSQVLVGEPIATLLGFAKTHHVNHIVVGHRRVASLTQWLLGSVAKGVVDGASCTVTVVR